LIGSKLATLCHVANVKSQQNKIRGRFKFDIENTRRVENSLLQKISKFTFSMNLFF
jgi:hypothetical protein